MTTSSIINATSNSLIVSNGGTLNVSVGGIVSTTTVSSGGYLEVYSGGEAVGTFVSSGGRVQVYSGGSITSSTVGSGSVSAVISVLTGGTATGTMVQSGGKQYLSSGGSALDTVVSSGGREVLSSGGSSLSTTISHGGFETVSNGGIANDLTLLSGGSAYLSVGGTVSNVAITSGAELLVYSGATLVGTDLQVGGKIDLTAPGMTFASATAVQLNATTSLVEGGTTLALTFTSAATEFVRLTSDGGGGVMLSAYSGYVVSPGLTSSGLQVTSGEQIVVLSGGSATSSTISSGGIQFVSSGGTEQGTDLLSGGTIDLTTLAFSSGGTLSFNSTTDTLSITIGSGGYSEVLGGSYTGEYFALASDGGSGTDITISLTPCFARGTRISTARGDIAVEALAIGDLVATRGGARRPIRWIGHRRVDCQRHPRPEQAWPIRIAAHAFATNSPARDLWLSPEHAICVDDVLIRARSLVNGATLRQMPLHSVEYWHIELDGHDVVLAEGLAVETYLDLGNRASFANAESVQALHADFTPQSDAATCLPIVETGAALKAARAHLLARAEELGHRQDDDPDLHLLADGAILRPRRHGQAARFLVPAGTRDLRIVSRRFVPCQMQPDSQDTRTLGLPIGGIAIDDGLAVQRRVALNGAGFGAGWEAAEFDGAQRWTQGSATLLPSLWQDCAGEFFLRLELVASAARFWLPETTTGTRVASC